MAVDLEATGKLAWIISSYSIAQSATSPLVVAMSNYFGRKPVLLCSIVLFLVGTTMCSFDAVSKYTDKAIAKWLPVVLGRLVSGFGAAGIVSMPICIVGDKGVTSEEATEEEVTAKKARMRKWSNAIGLVYTIAGTIGGPLGGVLAQYLGWRWIFRIQMGICGVSFFLVLFFAGETKQREDTSRPDYDPIDSQVPKSASEIDWAGGCLLFISTASLLIALTLGANVLSWGNRYTLLMIGVALAMALSFVLWEYQVDKKIRLEKAGEHPTGCLARIPVTLPVIEFQDFTLQTATARCGSFFTSFAQGIVTFWVPIYIESLGVSVLDTGLWLLLPSGATLLVYVLSLLLPTFFSRWLKGLIVSTAFLQTLFTAPFLPIIIYEWSWKGAIIPILTIYAAVSTLPATGLYGVMYDILAGIASAKGRTTEPAIKKFVATGQSTNHIIAGLGFSLSVPFASVAYQTTHQYYVVFIMALVAAAISFVFFVLFSRAEGPPTVADVTTDATTDATTGETVEHLSVENSTSAALETATPSVGAHVVARHEDQPPALAPAPTALLMDWRTHTGGNAFASARRTNRGRRLSLRGPSPVRRQPSRRPVSAPAPFSMERELRGTG